MLSTADRFDAQGVQDYLEANGLDPVPLDEPKSYYLKGVSLLVEPYSWGRVFFAEDRAHRNALTWCEREGEERPELPMWADDVRARVSRPSCLGSHEDDHMCDGGMNPVTGIKERACRWRKVCLHVQRIGKTEEGIAAFLANNDDDELWTRADPVTVGKTAAGRARGRGVSAASSADLVRKCVSLVCEQGGWKLAESRYRSAVGEMFLVEYDDGEKFTLFRRRLIGDHPQGDATTEQSIANFKVHKRDVSFRVEIRTGNAALVQEVAKDLRPQMRKDHYLDIAAMTADVESVDVVADLITRVVETNSLSSFGKGVKRPEDRRSRYHRGS